jgi:hypothetical protein|nr:MAG TPA: hypothetical protein [Caudoviricetes sp.]
MRRFDNSLYGKPTNFGRELRFMETLKNKLCAVGLLVCGGLSAYVGSDGTAMALLGTIAVPLFFAKENWIY